MEASMENLGSTQIQGISLASYPELGHHLGKRGVPHPEQCVLSDQEDEIVQHIYISSLLVFSPAVLV